MAKRYTDLEKQSLKHAREAAGPIRGLADLLTFVNHNERPWTKRWPGMAGRTLNGESFSEEEADDLQRQVRSQLAAAIRHTTGSTARRPPLWFNMPVEVRVSYRLHQHRGRPHITIEGPHDLGEYYDWVLLEALRTGQINKIRQCSECGKFVSGLRSSRRYCGARCRRDANAASKASAPAKNAARQRKHLRTIFGR